MYRLFYTETADRDIARLEPQVAARILKKVLFYSRQRNPLGFAKRLINAEIGKYRFRVGDYRVVFDIDSKGEIRILLILRVKHRKDIYGV